MWQALAGLALGGLGTFLGGRAGDIKKKELSALGDYPGLDTGAITEQALGDLERFLPRDIDLARRTTEANQDILNSLYEDNVPGYAARRGKQADIIDDFLAGEVPEDVSRAVERSALGRGLTLGIGGSGLGRSLTARDLGRTSLDLIGSGMGFANQFTQATPITNPTNPLAFAGPLPNQLAAIRGHERDQKLNIAMARAGIQGQTGAWGDFFTQLGGSLMGFGMGGGGGSGGASSAPAGTQLSSFGGIEF
jgi:hypothetical protein